MLAFARREFDSFFFNSHPVAAPVITSQTDDQAVGDVPERPTPTATLTSRSGSRAAPGPGRHRPGHRNVHLHPVVDFSTLGGSDSFTVEVSGGSGCTAWTAWEIGQLHPRHPISSAPVIGLPAPNVADGHRDDQLHRHRRSDRPGLPRRIPLGVATSGFQSEMGGGAPLDVNSDWWQWLHDPVNKLLLGWHSDALPGERARHLPDVRERRAAGRRRGRRRHLRMGIRMEPHLPQFDCSGGYLGRLHRRCPATARRAGRPGRGGALRQRSRRCTPSAWSRW